MAEGIVDVLELAQIEIEQDAVGGAAGAARDLAFQFGPEVVAIVQSGQGIVLGLVGQFPLEGLLFGSGAPDMLSGGASTTASRQ